jgi:O-acetylhomoserine (thiol)-lyase
MRARKEGIRDFGACMAPMTAFQILQGLETLPLRMAKHVSNTQTIVEFLSEQPVIEKISYPGLETHPDFALAKSLMPKGAGAVFSFELAGGREAGRTFIESLELFSHLANIGDAKSLVIHPASTTHHRMDEQSLRAAGIGAGLIRLSVGLEDPKDLIDDLKQGLKAVKKLVGNR